MTMLYRLVFLLLVVIIPASGYCLKDSTRQESFSPVEKFDPGRDAAGDIRLAITEAGRSGKRILLDVGGEWCIWCRKLDSFFVEQKDVAKYLHENYVVVKVNFSKENENEKVLSTYPKIEGYPHIFVLDSEGKLLHSQDTGALESGKHHDHDKVLAFLKRWAPPKKK
jgi:thioredoxin-related protein